MARTRDVVGIRVVIEGVNEDDIARSRTPLFTRLAMIDSTTSAA
jgi:hypothetical protein